MFILSFVLCYVLVLFRFNKKASVEENSSENLSFDKKDSLIIFSIFALGLIFQIVFSYIHVSTLVSLACLSAYSFVIIPVFVYVNVHREKEIEEYQSIVAKVYEALGTKIAPKVDKIDYANLPFELSFDENKQLNGVTAKTDFATLQNSEYASGITFSLNHAFSNFKWVSYADFEKGVFRFEAQKLPPKIAFFKGSNLRPATFVPVAVSGEGEVSWNMNYSGPLGESEWTYEDGTRTETVTAPTSPHLLVVGSSGGGKSVWTNQRVEIVKQ